LNLDLNLQKILCGTTKCKVFINIHRRASVDRGTVSSKTESDCCNR